MSFVAWISIMVCLSHILWHWAGPEFATDFPIPQCIKDRGKSPTADRAWIDHTITSSSGRGLLVETLVDGLDVPWDMTWGPDDWVWFTERSGRISRFHLESRRVERVGEIKVPRVRWTGLMGLAVHPQFKTHPYVFLIHSYTTQSRTFNRVVRMILSDGTLVHDKILLDGIPGKGNHNGGRITIGPDLMLYVTTGDAGDPGEAQKLNSLAGKVLRFTQDGLPPTDNPFGNYVWSLGHRNPQGLAFAPNGMALLSTEHGTTTADEINEITRGSNYGWPIVLGKCDTPIERKVCAGMRGPILEFSPTIGIAGIAVIDSMRLSEWNGNLLVVSLTGESLVRLALNHDKEVVAQEVLLDHTFGRLRDVVVSPDGDILVATSNLDERGKPDPCGDRIIRVRPQMAL